MSRRLLQRGRYPKAPGVDQVTSSNSQYPPAVPVSQPSQPGMNYYDPSRQSQPEQNSWNQQTYTPQANYQQPIAGASSIPEQTNYWSGAQMLPNSMQAPWNESWNAKPETIPNNSGFVNNQQPSSTQSGQQWQQVPYSTDNQGYSQSSATSYNSQTQQGYQYQTLPSTSDYQSVNNLANNVSAYNTSEYQSTSNIASYHQINNTANYLSSSSIASFPTTSTDASYQTVNNTTNYHTSDNISNYQSVNSAVEYSGANNNSNGAPSQNWENGAIGVTQPEELPWTYGTPQYCNPQLNEFSQSSNPSINASWHPSVNSCYDIKSDSVTHESVASNYLSHDSENSGVSEPVSKQEQSEQKDLKTYDSNNSGGASVHQDNICDTDYAPSALSAFFHSSDQIKHDNELEDQNKNLTSISQNVELSSQEKKSLSLAEGSSIHSSRAVSEEGSSEGTHSDFVQEESLDDSVIDEKSYSHSASPCLVEEPVNQEVPEPCKSILPGISVKNNKESDESGEEAPNQQVPTKSDHSSRSTSAERERLVIRPREESPFKPPRLNAKSTVVQKEVTVMNPVESKVPEEKTVVHQVNLETFPDNLERPSDYEELRKQSPLYAHKRHLRQELNSSPSSLLCDNPDIPCVTLAPAAPPISSAKSDKSESSTDSRSERVSLHSSNLSLYNLKESLPKLSTKDQIKKTEHNPISESSKRSQARDNISINSETSPNQIPVSSHPPTSLQQIQKESDSYNSASQQSIILKDTKLNGKGYTMNRSQESFQKYSGEYSDTSSNYSHREEPSYQRQKDNRYRDPKYDGGNDNRKRYPEQKYNYDERQYYSDRENSRPSSRNSTRREEYPYQSHPDDYQYHPHRNDPRPPQEFPRPSSRMSESDLNRSNKSGNYGEYYRQPYQYPSDAYPREHRDPRYRDYQRQHQKGYEYDPYQRDAYYAQYYDAYQRYAYNNFNYGFYDELYRNDPRYRQYREAQEQYRQYYASAKQSYDEYERSSVHSGRSSANELAKELSSSQYPEQDDSNESEFSAYNLQQSYAYTDRQNDISTAEADLTSTPSSRLTPVKFSYAHPIVRFSAGGLLITAIPSHVSNTTTMPIRIQNMQEIMEGEESFEELKNHQGPLIRGSTHKNDVIEFCSQRIKAIKGKEGVVDRDSYILLWELMVLLLRQNGAVAGSDIAELLLKDHEILRPASVPLKHPLDVPVGEQPSPADVNDSSGQSHAGDTSSPDEGIVVIHDKTVLNSRTVDIDKITRKFREFLLFGHKKDALEWAMKHGLWGHALFLASKMDLRTYANVMTRFANSLALNDPLQTLYQLMSGRQPLAVTNVADKKWGDWRPHLAMILSNPSTSPEVDSRSITTLGDTLASKGCLCAAHFCYIMAQVEFGTYEQKNSKFVLLTADHMLPFDEFATNEAIQCTEIYEYAQSLANPNFMLTHLQLYKFLYALRLVEHGFLEEALHYCEIISNKLQLHPVLFQYDFVTEVFKLATQLKYHDPHFLRGQGEYEDQDDPDWLKNLSSLVQNYNNLTAANDNYSNSYNEQQTEANQNFNTEPVQYSTSLDQTVHHAQNLTNSGVQSDINSSQPHINYYQPNNWNQQNNSMNSHYQPNNTLDNTGYYNQNDIAQNQGVNQFRRENSIPSHEENETTDVPSSPVTQTPPFDYYSAGTQQVQENKQMYDSSFNFNNSSLSRERRDSVLSSGSRYSSGSMSTINKNAIKETQKPEAKKDKATTQAGKTWLGGIFSRLLPKGPNQMILPDDKNPTIVWDDVKNCWVNKDSNDDDENSAPLAPPTDSELMGTKSSDSNFHSPNISLMQPMNSLATNNSVPPTSASQPVNKFQRPKTRAMRQNYVDVLSTSGVTKKNVIPEGLFSPTYENALSPNVFMPPPAPISIDNNSNLESNNASYNTPPVEEEQLAEIQATPMMFNPAEFDSRRTNTNNQRPSIGRMGRRTYPT